MAPCKLNIVPVAHLVTCYTAVAVGVTCIVRAIQQVQQQQTGRPAAGAAIIKVKRGRKKTSKS